MNEYEIDSKVSQLVGGTLTVASARAGRFPATSLIIEYPQKLFRYWPVKSTAYLFDEYIETLDNVPKKTIIRLWDEVARDGALPMFCRAHDFMEEVFKFEKVNVAVQSYYSQESVGHYVVIKKDYTKLAEAECSTLPMAYALAYIAYKENNHGNA